MSETVKVPDGYTFVKPIDSGGFGSVVELMENSTKEHYAGKMIPFVTAKDKERIDREVNRLRMFVHPGIVGLKEVASMDNMKVIVMELGGQSLAEIVRDHTSRGVLVAREVVYRAMVDVSSALNLMHNHESGGTAHGDVKMENILLFPGGHFKLCDLGAAESEDVSSTRGVMSQLYVSPERMESETGKATCSSDVWSLGIVLHWLLFGEPPFTNKSLLKLGQEISSFSVSMIGSSCGGEERALLMRMLDPNPEIRVTSSQLCSFGVFRCLVNTPSAVWRLKDADDHTLSTRMEMLKVEHETERQQQLVKIARLEKSEQELEILKCTQKQTLDELKTEQATNRSLETELKNLQEKLRGQEIELEMEKNACKLAEEKISRLERELAESRSNQTQTPSASPPHSSRVGSTTPHASSPARQGTVRQSQKGAAAIELFNRKDWKVSRHVFSKTLDSWASLLSFELGAVVARLSLTIKKGPNAGFDIGIISSEQSDEALWDHFPKLKGGAGWELFIDWRFAMQNDKVTNRERACRAGNKGQRMVLEADGREGKRTLKLSQDGETQPVFFTNIPVPFRFAVYVYLKKDAVEIGSVEVVDEPQMVGGSIPIEMDE